MESIPRFHLRQLAGGIIRWERGRRMKAYYW